MIDQFVALCFRKRLVVWLIAIFACILGIYAWTQLAIDAYPLLSAVTVQVTTQVPGLAAEEVEQQITIPLERALNGTPGLTNMRSVSAFALSQINLLFRDGAEDYWKRQSVRERIADVDPARRCIRRTRRRDDTGIGDLPLHARIRQQEFDGVVRISTLGRPTGAATGSRCRRSRQFRRVHPAIQGRSRPPMRVVAGWCGAIQNFIVRGVGLVHSLDDLGNVVVTQPTPCRSWCAISEPLS